MIICRRTGSYYPHCGLIAKSCLSVCLSVCTDNLKLLIAADGLVINYTPVLYCLYSVIQV